MAKQKLHKNILPLLAVTALLLSVSLANYNDSFLSGNKSTQSVLSESDENREGYEDESREGRTEEKRVEEKSEVKNKQTGSEQTRARVETKEQVKVEDKNTMINRETVVESKRILGLFKVNVAKSVTVDVDSGEVIETKRSLWNRFLNLLSN